MTSSTGPVVLKSIFSEIRQHATAIPEPKDYFEGSSIPVDGLPGKILCFARHRAEGLLSTPSHKANQHHRCVLLFAVQGSGRICLDADNFLLNEGQAQLIAPFQFHSYLELRSRELCWIFVTFETLALGVIEALRSSPARTLGTTEAILLRELILCWLDAGRHSLLPLHLGLLLGRLAEIKTPPLKTLTRIRQNSDADLIARINSYVLPRLDQPLGLHQLAHALGDSESHLRAKFRSATGGSLGRHLRQLRLQKACSLLYSSSLSIGEIGECCGFESVYSFSRAFKAGYSVSPRAYRLSAREDAPCS